MPGPVAPLSAGLGATPEIRTPVQAAKAFETMMLQQLLRSMSKTVGKSEFLGGGFEGNLYGEMFVSAIAEKAAGKGLGLGDMIQRALGVDERISGKISSLGNTLRGMGAYRAAVSGATEPPANHALANVADMWLSQEAPARWGREGALTSQDLAADLITEGVGGAAAFNVRDASGYQGHPKCNLFAFEMLRRAGYSVPVRPRSRGWGYPGADAVARWSENGDIEGWARVRSGATAADLDAVARGGQPLLLASSAPENRAGHMAVADRIHEVKRNAEGKIVTIEYSGWEAGSKRASYGRRVWRLASVRGTGRGGLDRIEVLEPHLASVGNSYHFIGKGRPGASVLDGQQKMHDKIQGLGTGSDDR
ncbi:MAG: hypothetical protein GY854_30960 [Deltaproteobacteria bacterium]|nr:hypothetical protein [Deltaproteobacteria bacterium]